MSDGQTISPKLVRYPIIPLSYERKEIAVPREIIIDYDYGRMYVLKEDGSEYLRLMPGSEPFAGAVFTITIGDNIHSIYNINHNLKTEDVLVNIVKLDVKKNVLVDYTIVDDNNITINFDDVIDVDTYRVIVCVPGGGPTTFLSLKDAPKSFVGEQGKVVSVKADQTGLEFINKKDVVAGSKFIIVIGDNIHSIYTINHNLGTEDVLVNIIKLETKKNAIVDFTIIDENNITIDFGEIIDVDSYKVIVL